MPVFRSEVPVDPKQLGIAMAKPLHELRVCGSVAIGLGDKIVAQAVDGPVLEADLPFRSRKFPEQRRD